MGDILTMQAVLPGIDEHIISLVINFEDSLD
jgi:hypothetical protein